MKKVLVGTTVRQDPRILEYYLDSLRNLNTPDFIIDYMFIDDNDDPQASHLLLNFRPLRSKVTVRNSDQGREPFRRDEIHHHWNEQLIWRVARNKNKIIDHCKQERYDYLFLVDSDLVLHPQTLARLIATGKDIISEIYWTKWRPNAIPMPQVWLSDSYTICQLARGEKVSNEEEQHRVFEFFNMLRRPGVYRVGGLGACTLFILRALDSGVSFDEIYNLSFIGEDRHLCIRAAALGFELFVDTCFPAYHIYRESDLDGVPEYLESFRKMSMDSNSSEITSMVKKTLEKLESIDFRQKTDLNGYRNRFTERGWKAFLRFREGLSTSSKTSILRAELPSISRLEFNDNLDQCNVTIELNLRGSKNGERVEVTREIRLEMINEETWKIDRYESGLEREGCRESPVINSVFNGHPRVVKACPQKITLAMLVRNEADRYLPAVLQQAAQYVDEAVILDDASTDKTVEVCRELLKGIPSFIHVNQSPGFGNEINLRQQLWELAVQSSAEWILCLDADEVFEDRVVSEIRTLVNQPHIDVIGFRLYDFWDMEHYREDEFWNAHLRYAPFLVRYQSKFPYQWLETPLHCGRFPQNVTLLPSAVSNLRLKHFGWATTEDRQIKYTRYKEADPDGKYGILKQYESILDPKPNLIKWRENE